MSSGCGEQKFCQSAQSKYCQTLFLSEPCADLSPEDSSCHRLNFYHFDISRLLRHGASLLGSAGAEFELQDEKTGGF